MVDQLKQLGECEVGKVLTVVEEAIADDSLILDYGTTTYIYSPRRFISSHWSLRNLAILWLLVVATESL